MVGSYDNVLPTAPAGAGSRSSRIIGNKHAALDGGDCMLVFASIKTIAAISATPASRPIMCVKRAADRDNNRTHDYRHRTTAFDAGDRRACSGRDYRCWRKRNVHNRDSR